MVYWFGINADIEKFVNSCEACGSMAIPRQPKTESEWIPTTRPFSRVHIDFFYFEHRTYLLIVDSYSKWIEIELMHQGTDCNKVLKKLVEFFARFGLPDVLVSDNGPPFNSHDFKIFLERQGIKVMKSPPYHPSSNGQAERLVRTVKEVLKRFLLEPEVMRIDLEDQINLFLSSYRNNNMTRDGHFPSERIFSYAPKTILHLINPKKQYKHQLAVSQPNEEIITEHSTGVVPKHSHDAFDNLMVGDDLWYKNHSPHHHSRWIKATFMKKYSLNTFQIRIGNVEAMVHRDQIRIRKDDASERKPNVFITQSGPDEAISETIVDRNEGQESREGEVTDLTSKSVRSRKRKCVITEPELGEPRRSKRTKKPNRVDEYCYD